ncbi:hypothetical protein [Robertmurraya sp. P23]|uniref:hypothetical protein n=1 Tax=Robertmurraya sp. P23 TaxID=3436931 RepID=UPI003D98522C
MFYQDYHAIAKLKQQEVERNARHAWKFFEREESKKISIPVPRKDPNCCVTPANA